MTPYDPDNSMLRHKLAQELRGALETAGFALDEGRTRKELVFSRRVTFKDGRELPCTDVVVYTTIEGNSVRALGKDAIRVCVVYNREKSRGLSKETRVFRVGNIEDIISRTVERMRNAWTTAKELPRCRHCGTPEFVSKAGNKVCAAFCWEKRPAKVAPQVRHYSRDEALHEIEKGLRTDPAPWDLLPTGDEFTPAGRLRLQREIEDRTAFGILPMPKDWDGELPEGDEP